MQSATKKEELKMLSLLVIKPLPIICFSSCDDTMKSELDCSRTSLLLVISLELIDDKGLRPERKSMNCVVKAGLQISSWLLDAVHLKGKFRLFSRALKALSSSISS